MRQVVCNYAPVRFLPYRDIGEFVTVGVVLHCPNTGYFGHRLVPARKKGRVTAFFPELDPQILTAALEGVGRQLGRVSQQFPQDQRSAASAEVQLRRFAELIRRREGLLHFGEPGTRLAADPAAALDDLFEHYVNRQFAQRREVQEEHMRKQLASFLREWDLADRYQHNRRVGDDDFHVKMPFVHAEADLVIKAVKPLNLAQSEPTAIYQHGGTWVKTMERLKQRQRMPRSTVFTVQLPEPGRRREAAETISSELTQLGVDVVDFASLQRVHVQV